MENKKKGNGLRFAIGAALLALAVGSVVIGLILAKKLTADKDPKEQLFAAVKNTLEDDPAMKILTSGEYCIAFDGKYIDGESGKYAAEGTFSCKDSGRLLDAEADLPKKPKIEVTAELSEDTLKVAVPSFDSHTFLYSYKDPDKGILGQLIKAIDFDGLDAVVNSVFQLSMSAKADEALVQAMTEQAKTFDVKETEEVNMTYQGKDVKAKSFAVSISADAAVNGMNLVLDELEKRGVDVEKTVQAVGKGTFDREQTEQNIRNAEDLQVTVYVANDRVIGLQTQSDGRTFTVTATSEQEYKIETVREQAGENEPKKVTVTAHRSMTESGVKYELDSLSTDLEPEVDADLCVEISDRAVWKEFSGEEMNLSDMKASDLMQLLPVIMGGFE